jgi:hypothetical protein
VLGEKLYRGFTVYVGTRKNRTTYRGVKEEEFGGKRFWRRDLEKPMQIWMLGGSRIQE